MGSVLFFRVFGHAAACNAAICFPVCLFNGRFVSYLGNMTYNNLFQDSLTFTRSVARKFPVSGRLQLGLRRVIVGPLFLGRFVFRLRSMFLASLGRRQLVIRVLTRCLISVSPLNVCVSRGVRHVLGTAISVGHSGRHLRRVTVHVRVYQT